MTDNELESTTDESDVDAADPGNAREAASGPTSLTDPESIRDRDGVEYDERTYVHGDPEHCEADADGRTIVGVTDGSGRTLLLVDESESVALLPNEPVEPGGDWADCARRVAEATVGHPVEIDAVERVRAVRHRVEGDGDLQTRTHHVVFRASLEVEEPAGGLDVEGSGDWNAGWYGAAPVDVDPEEPASPGQVDAPSDIGLFVD